MTTAPSRRWLQFSLRTWVVLLPIAVGLAYWGYRYQAARSARAEYDRAFALWQDERIANEDVLDASENWLSAALAVPFASKDEIYKLHAGFFERTP